MTTLTVQLSDEAAREAFLRAARQGQSTAEFVSSMVEETLVVAAAGFQSAVTKLSDEDVLAMADFRLHPEEDRRLSELLDRNSEGPLDEQQAAELTQLLKLSNEGLLRKSIGWAEAVRRKLRTPPLP